MKTRLLDSPAKRISIAVATLAGVVLLVAAAYTFMGSSFSHPVNGQKIIAAAKAYTRALRFSNMPIPSSVPLQTLVDQKLLQPSDVGSFQGMEAILYLTADAKEGEQAVIMRVHPPQGPDLVLLADGSTREVKR